METWPHKMKETTTPSIYFLVHSSAGRSFLFHFYMRTRSQVLIFCMDTSARREAVVIDHSRLSIQNPVHNFFVRMHHFLIQAQQ
jgi:hypothetical protein